MSRSGYIEDDEDQWQVIRWRGAVASAINGKRGQAFLLEMYRAIDALPERKLIADELVQDGAVCAIGAVGKARGLDMTKIDPHDPETVAGTFGIPDALAREIVYMNDEGSWQETPEQRYERMKKWAAENLLPVEEPS
jgi:hypothetical protein